MGIKITSVAEALENNGLKMLVHGQAGSGKTVLCATTGAPTLIISAEAGLLSIAEAPDYIKTTVVKTIDELEQAYDYIESNIDEFEWICIDSISEIAEVLLSDEKRNSKDPRQAYGNLSDRMSGILRSFRDLPNMNVLMTCKQQRQVDEDTNVTRFVPLLPGKALTNSIAYLFDEVFAARVEKDEEGEDYYTLQTHRDRNYEAKDRSNMLEIFEEPSIKRIAAKIVSGQPEKVVKENSEEVIDSGELMENAYDENETEKSVEKHRSEPEEKDEELNVETTDSSDDLIVAGDKPVYLYHNASDAVLKLSKGEECANDGNVEVIEYAAYMKHKKRIAKLEKES